MSKRFLLLVTLGFIVNAILEYQFVLLVEPFMEISRLTATLFISLIDTLFLIIIYWILCLNKAPQLDLKQILIIVLIASTTSVVAEWIATSLGIWTYRDVALVIPFTNTILVALIHYSIVPAAIFYTITRLTKPA